MKLKRPNAALVCALLIFSGCAAAQTFVNTEVEDIKYSNRVYSTGTHLGETVHGIIGLVTQQVEDPNTKTAISLARIVPGQFIVETISMLPEPMP